MIDFGLNDIKVDLGLEEPKKKSIKPVDPKDQFGMNDLADDMKKDTQDMVNDIKKDIENVKKDYYAIKGEIIPIVNEIKDYFAEKKVRKQLKNIQAFSSTVRAQRLLKEEKISK